MTAECVCGSPAMKRRRYCWRCVPERTPAEWDDPTALHIDDDHERRRLLRGIETARHALKGDR